MPDFIETIRTEDPVLGMLLFRPYVFNFPDGMTGTHVFVGIFLGPCQAMVNQGSPPDHAPTRTRPAMAKAMTIVGLDVHARQTHAAVLDPATGEFGLSKLRMPPEAVVAFLQRLGPAVRAVYAAGPTGFGLARVARECGIDVRVAAPGSLPKGAGDRVKTDRRDAVRLARLLAAGELSFAFVPSVADECFRDLVRCIEDARGDLMRARHRLSKFLLRRGERYPGPGGAWTRRHMAWLRAHEFADSCSQATFVDYLAAVELLAGRRGSLLETLERAVPESSQAPLRARLRCFRGIDTLSAAGLAAEVGDFARFPWRVRRDNVTAITRRSRQDPGHT